MRKFVKTTLIDGSKNEVEALIVAAEMDGCWKALTEEEGVHVYKLSNSSRIRIVSWLVSGREEQAWERLTELAMQMGFR